MLPNDNFSSQEEMKSARHGNYVGKYNILYKYIFFTFPFKSIQLKFIKLFLGLYNCILICVITAAQRKRREKKFIL